MDINAIDKLLGQLRAGAAMAGQTVGGLGAAGEKGGVFGFVHDVILGRAL